MIGVHIVVRGKNHFTDSVCERAVIRDVSCCQTTGDQLYRTLLSSQIERLLFRKYRSRGDALGAVGGGETGVNITSGVSFRVTSQMQADDTSDVLDPVVDSAW